MHIMVRNLPNFCSGLMFTFIGVGFSYGATQYHLGTVAEMGPGYFPLVLGGLLAILGLSITVRSVLVDERDGAISVRLRPIVFVLGSVCLFAVMLAPAGLVAASFVMVLVGSFASEEFSWKYVVPTALLLVAASYLIFVYGLGLPMPVWPRGF